MKKLTILFLFLISFSCYSQVISSPFKLLIITSQKKAPYIEIQQFFYQKLGQRKVMLGKDLVIEEFNIGNNHKMVKNILQFFLKEDTGAILTIGTMATIGAKEYLKNKRIPIIYTGVTSPNEIGILNDADKNNQFRGIQYYVPMDKKLDLIKLLFPKARRLGLIYADMPQSRSYVKQFIDVLKRDKYKDLDLITREVPFIMSEEGNTRMVLLARESLKEMDNKIDLYIAANDQMGVQKSFRKMVERNSNRPLIGLGKADAAENDVAVASLYPSQKDMGFKAADMIIRLIKGDKLEDISSSQSAFEVMINKTKCAEYKIEIPSQQELDKILKQ